MPYHHIILLLFALALIGFRVAQAELPLPLVEAKAQILAREQVLDGVVEAVNRSTVSAQTTGRVKEILVDVNDYVEKGATIIRFSDTEQRANVNQAEATLREVQARLNEAQAEYNRVKEIYAKNLIAKASLDAANATLNAAKARFEAAQAGVTQAREQLDYTVINAPYSGVVLERHVQIGESVQPGQPLMTGFSLEELRVVANVPQRLIVSVRQHSQARVILPHGQDSIAAERLTFFPYADPQSNVFKVRVYLPKRTQDLYPGMFVKTAFTVGQESRLVVPRQALAYRSEVTGVYVVKDEQISLRQVRSGSRVGDDIEILAGLDPGEQVAMDPIAAGIYLKEMSKGK
jgi:RND family efflux transporter MFP subunit